MCLIGGCDCKEYIEDKENTIPRKARKEFTTTVFPTKDEKFDLKGLPPREDAGDQD